MGVCDVKTEWDLDELFGIPLYDALEQACATLKHVPEQMDPVALRALLRRAQDAVDAYESLLRNATDVSVTADGDGDRVVSITSTLGSDALRTLFATLADVS